MPNKVINAPRGFWLIEIGKSYTYHLMPAGGEVKPLCPAEPPKSGPHQNAPWAIAGLARETWAAKAKLCEKCDELARAVLD